MLIEEIKEYVKSTLSEKRYIHSLNTAEKCMELAKKYNVDEEEAYLTGLVHDIAKEMGKEELYEYAIKSNITINEVEKVNKGMLHAKVGADIIAKKYNFPEYMIKAIKYHNTSYANMDIFSKIIFIADKTEKGRDYPDVEYARNLVNENIDKGILYILDFIIKERILEGKTIHPESINSRNYIILNCKISE